MTVRLFYTGMSDTASNNCQCSEATNFGQVQGATVSRPRYYVASSHDFLTGGGKSGNMSCPRIANFHFHGDAVKNLQFSQV